MAEKLLTAVIFGVGLVLMSIAANTALGGMATLGWQFPSSVMTITDTENFARHDSNARFFAGTFIGLGLVISLSAFLPRFRPVSAILLICMALGGVFRLLQPEYSPLGDAALTPSILFEIVVFPFLALWIMRARQ